MKRRKPQSEIQFLRERLREMEEAWQALRNREVDAILVSTPEGDQVFTLKGAEHFYRIMVENMEEGAATINSRGDIFYANQRLSRMLKVPLENLIGSSIKDYASDPSLFEKFLVQAQSGSGRGEFNLKSRDGHILPALVSISHLESENLFILILMDLSEVKKYTAMLEQKNKELQEFAFVASHDMREPLRKIQTFADRIGTAYEDVLPKEGRDYLLRMQNAARRMDEILSSLLGYSRVTTRTDPFALADLTGLVREAAADLRLLIEEKGARVKIEDLPSAEVDPPQIRQLFQNLLHNGLKFNSASHPEIRIHGRVEGGACRILVRDNGIGFEEKYLDRIFAPFQRLHGRGEYEGIGMGLSICRKIVERHGGSIAAQSAPGKGSTFIVRLPLKQP